MAHDVFISYSSIDKPIADGICASLEATGIRCWIAPRDIAPGEDWPSAISNAITHSQAMVLVFSSHSNSSDDVSREINLAATNKLIIVPFKIENVEPEPGIKYYLSRTHWLDAMNPPTQEQIHLLTERVTKILFPDTPLAEPVKAPASGAPALFPKKAQPSKVRKMAPWLIGVGSLGLLAVMVIICGTTVWLGRTFLFPKVAASTPTPNNPSGNPGVPTDNIFYPPTLTAESIVIPAAPTKSDLFQPPSTQSAPQETLAPGFGVDIKRISYFETQVLDMVWLPDSKKVILCGFELQPYDVASQTATLPLNQRVLDDVDVSPDASMFAVASTWEGIQTFDQNWGALGTLPMSTEGHAVLFTPDGMKIMAAEGNLIKVWDAATQQELAPFPLGGKADALAISSDGKTLAASIGMEIKVLTIDGEELFTLKGHGHQIIGLAFSSDGKLLASGSYDNTARLWDLSTGRQLRVLSGHTASVHGVGFSPDGKMLASGSDDTTARVWDVSSGALLQTLYDHTESVTSVAFSPDGTMLATGSYDKMQLWSVGYKNP